MVKLVQERERERQTESDRDRERVTMFIIITGLNSCEHRMSVCVCRILEGAQRLDRLTTRTTLQEGNNKFKFAENDNGNDNVVC